MPGIGPVVGGVPVSVDKSVEIIIDVTNVTPSDVGAPRISVRKNLSPVD